MCNEELLRRLTSVLEAAKNRAQEERVRYSPYTIPEMKMALKFQLLGVGLATTRSLDRAIMAPSLNTASRTISRVGKYLQTRLAVRHYEQHIRQSCPACHSILTHSFLHADCEMQRLQTGRTCRWQAAGMCLSYVCHGSMICNKSGMHRKLTSCR